MESESLRIGIVSSESNRTGIVFNFTMPTPICGVTFFLVIMNKAKKEKKNWGVHCNI